MALIRIFRYLPEVDAFDVTPAYQELAEILGIGEWNPVVWIGRLFIMDNDFGEHWFDNWDARELRRSDAERHGLDVDRLFFIDPERFQDGRDGPCNTPEFRGRFWKEVLRSLELSTDLLFDEARQRNARIKEFLDSNPEDSGSPDDFVPDLEVRIAGWVRSREGT